MKKSALLVVNGELPNSQLIHVLKEKTTLTIATDGAAQALRNCGILPDIVIGDMDSLSLSERKFFEAERTVIEKPSQYATDFEKALDYLEREEVQEISLVGIQGGRFDHAFTNTSVLAKNASRFVFRLFDDDGYGFVLTEENPRIELALSVGSTVSLLPLPTAEGITTTGLRYPLNDEALIFGDRDGQSNEVSESQVDVTLKKGSLILFICNGQGIFAGDFLLKTR